VPDVVDLLHSSSPTMPATILRLIISCHESPLANPWPLCRCLVLRMDYRLLECCNDSSPCLLPRILCPGCPWLSLSLFFISPVDDLLSFSLSCGHSRNLVHRPELPCAPFNDLDLFHVTMTPRVPCPKVGGDLHTSDPWQRERPLQLNYLPASHVCTVPGRQHQNIPCISPWTVMPTSFGAVTTSPFFN